MSAADTRDVLEAFRQALATGDLQRLLDLLAPNVVLLADGGGVVAAALKPIAGADAVARILRRIAPTAELEPTEINGHPALMIRLAGELDTVITVRMDDGLITGLYAVRNPEKLSHMARATKLRR
jgi:RNA polymerase sigma-70 factor (ECF subfamily)